MGKSIAIISGQIWEVMYDKIEVYPLPPHVMITIDLYIGDKFIIVANVEPNWSYNKISFWGVDVWIWSKTLIRHCKLIG